MDRTEQAAAKIERAVEMALRLADIIEETAKEAGDQGVPEGLVYITLDSQLGIGLTVFNAIISGLVKAGRITVEHNVIRAVAK